MTRQGETTGFVPPAALDEGRAAVRECLIHGIAGDLERSIANIGHLVGMGLAPHPDMCRLAATNILERITPKALALLAASPEQPASEAVGAIEELRAGKDELLRLMDSIWRAEFSKEAPNWKPLDYLAGMVSQIDNMCAGVRSQRDEARWKLAERSTRVDGGREAALLAFVLRCSAMNPAATCPRNEAVELLERFGIKPREPGLFYHDPLADERDAAALIAAHPAESASDDDDEHPYEADGYLTIDHGPPENTNCAATLAERGRRAKAIADESHDRGSVAWCAAYDAAAKALTPPANSEHPAESANCPVGGEALREVAAKAGYEAWYRGAKFENERTQRDIWYRVADAILAALPPAGAGDVGYARGVEDAAKVADGALVSGNDKWSEGAAHTSRKIASAIRALSPTLSIPSALTEASKRLALTQGCLDCNADDERFWIGVVAFLEGKM